MKRIAVLLLLLFAIGCATDDDFNEPRRGRGGDRGDGGDYQPRPAMAAGELVPPARWWRDPQISAALNLSPDQFQRLDAIDARDSAELERLTHEAANAQRDFRLLLDAENPAESDLVAGGQRLRDARDRLLALQVRTLAAQRAVLTRDQWRALQSAFQNERRGERQQRGGYPGGMGGRGRGGRRPF
jgi:Spy/CpxP family protein refolding chaperone